jgi:glycosyltransferase 2 family protein
MRRATGWLARNFRALALLCSAGGLMLVLWSDRNAISTFPWRLSSPLFALAVVVFAVGPVAGATSFWLIVRDLTGTSAFAPTLQLWVRGFLARYVPLGAVTVAVRLRGRGRLDASRRQMLSATAYEQAACLLGGATAATVGLAPSNHALAAVSATIIVIVLAAAIAAPSLAGRLGRMPRLGKLTLEPVPHRTLARAGLTTCIGWFASGTAVWILLNALSPDAPTLPFATGAYAFAWSIGFVVPFAPSGLGIREATLIGVLAPRFGVGPAAAIAAVLRFANVVGDLLAAAAVEGMRAAADHLRTRVLVEHA